MIDTYRDRGFISIGLKQKDGVVVSLSAVVYGSDGRRVDAISLCTNSDYGEVTHGYYGEMLWTFMPFCKEYYQKGYVVLTDSAFGDTFRVFFDSLRVGVLSGISELPVHAFDLSGFYGLDLSESAEMFGVCSEVSVVGSESELICERNYLLAKRILQKGAVVRYEVS